MKTSVEKRKMQQLNVDAGQADLITRDFIIM